MEQERRAFLRVETDISVLCAKLEHDGEGGTPFTATALNLSAGGAKLAAADAPEPAATGQRHWLELRFHTPRLLVFTEASVVRVDADGFAVHFDELEEYTLQRLVRWVYAQDRRLFERHAQARIPLRIRVLCHRIAPTGEAVEEFRAATVDFALDGVRVRCERLLPEGATVDVLLDFDDRLAPFSARTTVVSAEPQGDRIEYQLQLEGAGPARRRTLIERALAAERRRGS
jgi:c-di-GMP-binding flagellar brake protein YcgR